VFVYLTHAYGVYTHTHTHTHTHTQIILRLVGGMDGISMNNFLGYVVLHVLFAPCCILTGYFLSFFFAKEETAQVMTDQIVNLTVFIPWYIYVYVNKSIYIDIYIYMYNIHIYNIYIYL